MKKATVLFAAILMGMAGTQAFAQHSNSGNEKATHSGSGFFAGVRATPQTSWMLNKDDQDNSNYETRTRFGASFGLAGGYNFNSNIGIEVDALYSIEGKRYKLSGKEYTQNMNYVKIPVLFTYTTCPSTFMLVGKIGPQVNLLSAAKIDPAMVNGTSISDNKDQFENLVVGAVASAGVRYAATDRIRIDASVRYDASFTNVEDNTSSHFHEGRADTYNTTAGLELGVSYFFR